jgi:Uma2 family endonuclease
MSAPLNQTHRFNVVEFHRMAEAGILREDQRVELIEGEVTDMMPIGPYHASLVAHLSLMLTRLGLNRWLPWVQNPLRLSEHSELQPDIALVALREHRYLEAPPGPRDAFLVIEVADSSLAYDKNDKLPRYAQAGIAEVWIVNVPDRQVEVYREPAALAYGSVAILSSGQSASPAAFPDISIPVAELFR